MMIMFCNSKPGCSHTVFGGYLVVMYSHYSSPTRAGLHYKLSIGTCVKRSTSRPWTLRALHQCYITLYYSRWRVRVYAASASSFDRV